MNDPIEPLGVGAILVPDMSSGDWDRAIEDMWIINCLVSQSLSGEIPMDEVLDAIATFGADVDTYISNACDRIDQAIAQDLARDLDPSELLAYARY